ncbi:membrane protein [Caballeronia telluris]|uniref:Membrane protein n=1 Tax=Caballeronia telluris TaxID=326475 RepID=A0A158F7Z0_9BURK|nr:membrane protein [Caballeronia telluris]
MHRVDVTRPARLAARALATALLCGAFMQQPVSAQDGPLKFAVIANALTRPADAAPVRQLLDSIGRERDMAFIVYDGNIKGPLEPCRDRIYNARHDLLDASRTPLVLIAGQHDWADCGEAQAGGYDPVERLDFVRQLFFGDSTSLGSASFALARESEVARFRPFRENVRWRAQGVAFVGLNAPGPNNHYLTAGGRNGEFEDRTVANGFWLEHAAESARRSGERALVIFLEGDPDFARYERRDRFAWLRFTRGNQPRDGFVEFKRSLVKVAELFRGPVVVVHGAATPVAGGFLIDQPLHDEKGSLVVNLTRIAVALKKPQVQWLEVQTDANWRPPFRVRVRDVARHSAATSERPDKPYELHEPPPDDATASQPRDELPASLPPPALPPAAPGGLPPILTPPQGMPPILPTPASGVQNGTYKANPASGAGE